MGLTTPPAINETRRLTRNSIKTLDTAESKTAINGGSTEEKDFSRQEDAAERTNMNSISTILGRRTRNNPKRIENEDFIDSGDLEEEEKAPPSKRMRYY